MQTVVKRTIKDSVFTDLFSKKYYVLKLYRALHPEDMDTTEDDITMITLDNVLVNDIYNDLGFRIHDKLIVLVEAQSTWTENIVLRALMYMAKTYKDYCETQKLDLYSSRTVHLPEPELYVIYTGDRREHPDKISLSEAFFGGKEVAVNATVKMLYGDNGDDIIGQYVLFTKILNEQVGLHGLTVEAVKATIRICKNRNVLKEYLALRETEVHDIMLELFSQEVAYSIYEHNLIRDAEMMGEENGIRIGEAKGIRIGEAQILWKLINDRILTVYEACRRMGISEEEFNLYKPGAKGGAHE